MAQRESNLSLDCIAKPSTVCVNSLRKGQYCEESTQTGSSSSSRLPSSKPQSKKPACCQPQYLSRRQEIQIIHLDNDGVPGISMLEPVLLNRLDQPYIEESVLFWDHGIARKDRVPKDDEVSVKDPFLTHKGRRKAGLPQG